MHGYARFAAMIGTSTLAMFGLMDLNTFQLDHIFFSETRVYMALVMGATMAIIMLAFMWHMHSHRWANLGIDCNERHRVFRCAVARSEPAHRGGRASRTPAPASSPTTSGGKSRR